MHGYIYRQLIIFFGKETSNTKVVLSQFGNRPAELHALGLLMSVNVAFLSFRITY